jgi:hypothetical protein
VQEPIIDFSDTSDTPDSLVNVSNDFRPADGAYQSRSAAMYSHCDRIQVDIGYALVGKERFFNRPFKVPVSTVGWEIAKILDGQVGSDPPWAHFRNRVDRYQTNDFCGPLTFGQQMRYNLFVSYSKTHEPESQTGFEIDAAPFAQDDVCGVVVGIPCLRKFKGRFGRYIEVAAIRVGVVNQVSVYQGSMRDWKAVSQNYATHQVAIRIHPRAVEVSDPAINRRDLLAKYQVHVSALPLGT